MWRLINFLPQIEYFIIIISMNSNNLSTQVHKCISRNSNLSVPSFCSYCGVYMAQCRSATTFFRSEQYRIVDPYRLDANSLLTQMTAKQQNNRVYAPNAHYIKYRAELLRFLQYLRARLEYTSCTYYLAIGILDCFLSQYKVENDSLKIFCFMALHIAAKMEESSVNVPELSVIEKLFENKYTIEQIEDWELAITKALGYNINLRTPYTFVAHFLSRGVLNNADLNCATEAQADAQLQRYEQVVAELLDVASSHYDYNKYTPLQVACGILAAARKTIGLRMAWSHDLELLTCAKMREIEACMQSLLKESNTACDSMEIEENQNVNAGPTTRSAFCETTEYTSKKTTAPVSGPKRTRNNSEQTTIDTDEEEPVKNATVYSSQRVA